MNNCTYCNQPTQQKVCMDKSCRNRYKKAHYHANKERYQKLKKQEELRNRKSRTVKNKPKRLKKYYEDFANTLVKHAKARAKANSLDFEIDKKHVEWLYEFQGKKCILTRIPFQMEQLSEKKRRPFGPSLDRIDCNKGYTKENTRLVCSIVNIALSDFGDVAFDKMCREYMRNNA